MPNFTISTGFLLLRRLRSNLETPCDSVLLGITSRLDLLQPSAQSKQLTYGLAACMAPSQTSHFWTPRSLLILSLKPASSWASSCVASSCAGSLQRWWSPVHERAEQHPLCSPPWGWGMYRDRRGCCPATGMGRAHQLQHHPFLAAHGSCLCTIHHQHH